MWYMQYPLHWAVGVLATPETMLLAIFTLLYLNDLYANTCKFDDQRLETPVEVELKKLL